MKKYEKIGLGIGIITITVSLLAWQFPVGIPEINVINISRPVEIIRSHPAKTTVLLDQELTDSKFLSQIQNFSFEADKLNYLSKAKPLLKKNISFKELNLILNQFTFVSRKIEAVTILRDRVDQPNEKELEVYLAQFVFSSDKQRALDLVY